MSDIVDSPYWQWVIACTIGEIVGFVGIPVAGGAIVVWLTAELAPNVRSLCVFAAAGIGGLGEGAVLAHFQLRVLRRSLPAVNRRRWIVHTAGAASFAWFCGMLAPTIDDLIGLSVTSQIAIWLPASVAILLSIGTAQSWLLRGIVARPHRWITANVAGWLLGLPWTFVLPGLLPQSAPVAAWIAAFLVAGILMGLTVGLVTGRLVVRLHDELATR